MLPAKGLHSTRNSGSTGTESLEELRRGILMSLDKLREEEASHLLEVKRLRDQYNNIIEKLRNETPKLVTDPLERLPPEISLRCLSDSLPEWDYASHLLDLAVISS